MKSCFVRACGTMSCPWGYSKCLNRHCEERSDEAIHLQLRYPWLWIASRSLSSGAHSRDPLTRNDELKFHRRPSPRGSALHRGLTGRIRRPQVHAGAGVVGVDAELAAFEQRLHAAIAELLRRRAAMELRRKLHQKRRLHRAVEDQPGIALDLGDVVAVVMD